MGNFQRDRNDRGFDRDRSRGRSDNRDRSGGRGRDRSSRGFDRKRTEMFETTCDNCGKQCEVPFKPKGDKPVLCSDCYRKEGGNSRDSRQSSGSRDSSPQNGVTQKQFNELNDKVDRILDILESLEFEEADEDEEDEESPAK